jgi:hypothetical protein
VASPNARLPAAYSAGCSCARAEMRGQGTWPFRITTEDQRTMILNQQSAVTFPQQFS